MGMVADYLSAWFSVPLLVGLVAAWGSGRMAAKSWRPFPRVLPYILFLSLAVHFLDYALFETELLSLPLYVHDFIVLTGTTFLSYRFAWAHQLVSRYHWLYKRSVLFYMINGERSD